MKELSEINYFLTWQASYFQNDTYWNYQKIFEKFQVHRYSVCDIYDKIESRNNIQSACLFYGIHNLHRQGVFCCKTSHYQLCMHHNIDLFFYLDRSPNGSILMVTIFPPTLQGKLKFSYKTNISLPVKPSTEKKRFFLPLQLFLGQVLASQKLQYVVDKFNSIRFSKGLKSLSVLWTNKLSDFGESASFIGVTP